MSRRFVARAAMAAIFGVIGILVLLDTAFGQVEVQIGTVEAGPGQRVVVPVQVRPNGAALSAFQNDIDFPPAVLPRLADGGGRVRPDCAQNPDLLPGRLGARFSFPGLSCDADRCLVRAVVGLSEASFPDDDVVAYTCTVEIAPDAELGIYPLPCSALGTSDYDGQMPAGTCADGAIVVVSDPPPTAEPPPPTPEPPPPPTPSGSLPCDDCAVLEIGSASGQPGDRVSVDVRLRTGGLQISGLQADIGFSPQARIARRADGHPDCLYGANPNLAGFSSLEFQPVPCGYEAPETCTAIRVLALTSDLSPMPDGALLLSCAVEIATDADAGTYALQPTGTILASTPWGTEVDLAAVAGSVSVSEETPAGQQPVTGGSDTGSQVAAASAGGGGCAVAPPEHARAGWWLIGAALIAVGLRRRRP